MLSLFESSDVPAPTSASSTTSEEASLPPVELVDLDQLTVWKMLPKPSLEAFYLGSLVVTIVWMMFSGDGLIAAYLFLVVIGMIWVGTHILHQFMMKCEQFRAERGGHEARIKFLTEQFEEVEGVKAGEFAEAERVQSFFSKRLGRTTNVAYRLMKLYLEALRLQAKTEAARADAVRQGDKARARVCELEPDSVAAVNGLVSNDMVDELGRPITRKDATHFISLAFDNRTAEAIPIRFCDDTGFRFSARHKIHGFTVVISLLPSGHGYEVRVSDPQSHVAANTTFTVGEEPNDRVFFCGTRLAGAIRRSLVMAYGDCVAVQAYVDDARPARTYFERLRGRLQPNGGHTGTMIAPRPAVVS